MKTLHTSLTLHTLHILLSNDIKCASEAGRAEDVGTGGKDDHAVGRGAFFITDRAGKDGRRGRSGIELGERCEGRGLSIVEGIGEYD